MIFGECPYCGTFLEPLEIPDGLRLPAYTLLKCDECREEYWQKLSRVDPAAYKKELVILKDGKIVEIKE